jgi:hypothetical protein
MARVLTHRLRVCLKGLRLRVPKQHYRGATGGSWCCSYHQSRSAQTPFSSWKESFRFGEKEYLDWDKLRTVRMNQFYHFNQDQTSQILHEKYSETSLHYNNPFVNFAYI